MSYCRLIYMLSILCVRPTIKEKVGIPESFKVGWYPPPKKLGRVTLRSTINCSKPCSEVEWLVPWHFSNIPWQFWLKLLLHILFWCIAMHFQRLLLLFVSSNSGKRYWDWTLPRVRAKIELSTTFFMTTKWARVTVLRGIRTSPMGDERQWCPCLWTELHHSAK